MYKKSRVKRRKEGLGVVYYALRVLASYSGSFAKLRIDRILDGHCN